MFLEKSRMIVGISKGTFTKFEPHILMFTKISYFFDWIAYKTGLELPTCGEQAEIHDFHVVTVNLA